MQILLLVVLGALAGQTFAQEQPSYERILLPVNVGDRSGAFASRWRTDFVIRNEGNEPIDVIRLLCHQSCTCTSIRTGPCIPDLPLAPGAARRNFVITEQFPAALFYVDRGDVARASFNLRLYELSQGAGEFGTEIPIVRESELRSDTTWLPNVPVTDGARVHVRIYGVISPMGEGVVRIRVYPGDDVAETWNETRVLHPALIVGPVLQFRVPTPSDLDAPEPGYLEVLLPREVLGSAETVRVRIDSLTPGLRYWAMASITSNLTNRVTLVTPQ